MQRFSSAHVLSAISLFVALTGTAIAVEKDSVGTKQLKDHAVKESKLGDHAVTEAKIADNAVTGAKVDESTLGQVASAASAEKATTATTANRATSATNATNATNATSATTATDATNATTATNATNAAHATVADSAQTATTATSATSATTATTAATASNATLFAGRDLQGVRPSATGKSTTANLNLDPVLYLTPLTVPVNIPVGGADLIANASFGVENIAGAARQTQCRLMDDSAAPIGEAVTTIVPANSQTGVALTAFVNDLGATPAGNPQDIHVDCQGDGVAGDVRFDDGDLTVLRIPVG